MFVGKPGEYPIEEPFRYSTPGWKKGLPETNALVHFENLQLMALKFFITLARIDLSEGLKIKCQDVVLRVRFTYLKKIKTYIVSFLRRKT